MLLLHRIFRYKRQPFRALGDTPLPYGGECGADKGRDMLMLKYFLLFLVCFFLLVIALPVFFISFLAVPILLFAALII